MHRRVAPRVARGGDDLVGAVRHWLSGGTAAVPRGAERRAGAREGANRLAQGIEDAFQDHVTGLFAVAEITSAPPTAGLNAADATARLLISGAMVSPWASADRTLPDPDPVTASVLRLGKATIER